MEAFLMLDNLFVEWGRKKKQISVKAPAFCDVVTKLWSLGVGGDGHSWRFFFSLSTWRLADGLPVGVTRTLISCQPYHLCHNHHHHHHHHHQSSSPPPPPSNSFIWICVNPCRGPGANTFCRRAANVFWIWFACCSTFALAYHCYTITLHEMSNVMQYHYIAIQGTTLFKM